MATTVSFLGFLLQAILVSGLPFEEAVTNYKGYNGAQVLNILDTPYTMRIIRRRGLDVLSSNNTNVDVLVPEKKVKSVTDGLSSNNIPFSVMIDNLGDVIKQERRAAFRSRGLRDGLMANFYTYQRLDDIHSYMDHLAREYPDIASVGVMGYTHEKRPLKYLNISSGIPASNAVFIDGGKSLKAEIIRTCIPQGQDFTSSRMMMRGSEYAQENCRMVIGGISGGIHAREWVSPATVTYIMRELVESRDILPRGLLSVDFYILPVLNPDGYEYTFTHDRMWRKNRSPGSRCSGVDLNRNFGFMFGGKGTSGDECSVIYRGKSANSEAETQALTDFLLTLKGRLQAYISFHSYGQFLLVPYGYDRNAYAPNFGEMKRVADEAARAIRSKNGKQYTVGHTANTMYPAAGGSDDWTKANVGVKYAYCIELSDTGKYGFLLPAREILSTAQGAFEGVKVIAEAASKA